MNSKADSTFLHIHILTSSTWCHVGRVEKNADHTTKQALKNVATTKSNHQLLQSYGKLENATPTQKEKNADTPALL